MDEASADRDRGTDEGHEATEISYDEQRFPARPKPLRPRVRMRRRLFWRRTDRNGRPYGGNQAYVDLSLIHI